MANLSISVLDTTTYRSITTITEYKSLIVTDRYQEAGDFELQSYDVERILKLFPPDTIVGFNLTRSVHYVTEVSISHDYKNVPMITVKGRGFMHFFKRRAALWNLNPDFKWILKARYGWSYLNQLLSIVTAGSARPFPQDSFIHSNTVSIIGRGYNINNISNQGSVQDLAIEPTNLYDVLVKVMRMFDLGIAFDRHSPTSAVDGLDVVIYPAVSFNRAVTEMPQRSSVPPIKFDVRAGHVTDATYRLSNEEWRNIAYVMTSGETPDKNIAVATRGSYNEKSWRTRSAMILSGDKELSQVQLTHRAWTELASTSKSLRIEGRVSDNVPYLCLASVRNEGSNNPNFYYLGDVVLLVGEYDIREHVRVVEHTFSSNDQGERRYPTFNQVGSTYPVR